MSFQITEAHVLAFREGITVRAAQRESRLRGCVEIESGFSGKAVSRDFIGPRRPQKRTTRHGDTEYNDTVHDRRWIDLSVYDDADLIDKPDLVRTLTDPTNSYSAAMAQGFGRHQDEVICDGMIATIRTGEEGTGTAAFPAAFEFQEAGAAGQTLDKILRANRILDQGEQAAERYWAQTARQFADMLALTQVTSMDFNVIKALAAAEIGSFMSFTWKRVEDPILKLRIANKRRTHVWSRPSVAFAVGSDVQASIDRLPGKKNSTSIFYSADYGASRLDDTGVIIQECHEP